MIIFIYDKTFEGLLTALFEAYSRRSFPNLLLGEKDPLPLFCDEVFTVYTDQLKADRVWKGLERRLRKSSLSALAETWLSEAEGVDMLLFRYMRKAIDALSSIEYNLGDSDVIEVVKLWKKVHNECHRSIQFFRFQKALDGTYFAALSPLYNVLPLIVSYALDRFADQRWLLYDLSRGYGFYHEVDACEVSEVSFKDEDSLPFDGLLSKEIMDKDELLFQHLWQEYFHAIAIKDRLNPKLHKQYMPARFWKYMPEKY